MNRKRSSVWNHFSIKSNTITKCGYCPQEIRYSGGSTGNLIKHLKTKHITVHLNTVEGAKRQRCTSSRK